MTANVRFAKHDRQVRARALEVFRQRVRRKRSFQLVIAMTLLGGFLLQRLPSKHKVEAVRSEPRAVAAVPHEQTMASPPENQNVATLSDEQLLALFPAGSCYIAEVSGRKRLVFRNETLRSKYLN